MSDFLTNEEGRAEGIGAPAGAWEKTVEFDFDKVEDAALVVSETPSKHDPDALDAHASAGHDLIAVDGKSMAKAQGVLAPDRPLLPGGMYLVFASQRGQARRAVVVQTYEPRWKV